MHDNIVKYCGRPDNHEQLIIDNWNNTVGENDIIIHLGDIAAGIKGRDDTLKEIFGKLNGRKILIKGNHDHKTNTWYKQHLGFEDVLGWMIMDDVLLFHYPLRVNEYSSEREIARVEDMKRRVEKEGVNHIIHGHVHNRSTDLPNHYNVSVEAIDYTPIEINELLS